MKISPNKPFQVVYSLLSHECLGYLFEVFVVQLNEKGQLTWEYQTLTTRNYHEFAAGLDERDEACVKLIEGMKPAAIFEKYNTSKRKTIEEFYLKTFDPEKGDKEIAEAVNANIERRRGQIFELICPDKTLFIMGNDGNPMRQSVQIQAEAVEVLFHFMRNEENTHYFPSLKYQGNKLEFQYKDALILCDEPAWMLLNQKLYHFKPQLEGKKLRAFLNKKFVVIPKNMEEDYFRKFVKAMVARYPVHAKGFEITNTEKNCQYLLSYGPIVPKIDGDEKPSSKKALEAADRWQFVLSFQYGNNRFPWDGLAAEANVLFEKKGDSYAFQKIMRSLVKEKRSFQSLKSMGLPMEADGRATISRSDAVQWLTAHKQDLDQAGFTVQFKGDGSAPRYFLGKPEISIRIGEKFDWFDIQAIISFGQFQIPFLKIRQLILQKKKEFHLPDGSIAIIPDNWFHDYQDLFYFSETRPGEDGVYLRRQHFQLIQEWENQDLVKTSLKTKTLNDLKLETKEFPIPKNFKGTLPDIVAGLLAARKAKRKEAEKETDAFKKALLDAEQLAYKLTANSLYGQLGSGTFKIRLQHLAASVTAYGRKQIMFAKDVIEEFYGPAAGRSDCAAKTVYGDTDSLFIDFGVKNPKTGEHLEGKEAIEATMKLTTEAGQLVTKCLKAPHDFEYDKVFSPFIIFSKKRYVGNKYEESSEDYYQNSMGIATKRRDYAGIVKIIYGGAIRILLSEKDPVAAAKFVKEKLMDLADGKVSRTQLTLTKSLRAEYKSVTPPAHKILADRIKERDPGNAPASGDRISFLYVMPTAGQVASKLQGDRIETPIWIKEKDLKIDFKYYMEHQLMNPLSQLFALIVEELPGCAAPAGKSWTQATEADREIAATDYLFRDALNICEKGAKKRLVASMFGAAPVSTVAPVAARTRSKIIPQTQIKVQTKLFAQQMILKAMEKKAPKAKEG
jgi:hypothetical protein